jgi:hypothetical protein
MRKFSALITAAAAFALAACSTNSSTGSSTLSTATSATSAGSPSSTSAPTTPSSASTAGTPALAADSAATGVATPITITAGDTVITATLNDTQVARDFLQMLPVTLPWFRNSGIEFVIELPSPMTETGPFYTDVQPGDLVYYNPRDSITIIYEETSSVPTLTKMGEITSDLSVFRGLPDDVEMRVELA